MSLENLSPLVLASLARQLKSIATKPPEGVKYLPTEGNITEILAEIEGPEMTPYEHGVFRVKLVLGREFPATPPKGYFLTKIFHPNVSPTGDICVNTLKRDWKPETGLAHVLQVIRCLLIVPFPESSLNDDAGKMFMESYDEYARYARLMTSIHALPAPALPAAEDAVCGGESRAAGGAGCLAPDGPVGGGDAESAAPGSPSAATARPSAAEGADRKRKADKKKSLKRL